MASTTYVENQDDDFPIPSHRVVDNYLATYAATTIQRWFRGYRVRKEYLARRARIRKVELEWATHHDATYRVHMAARVIQTAWRGFRNRRIFDYYRDLIRFRERGDPRELLRVINPREAGLVDAASGIHVRFRLGGTTFPPLVFYKIFTHRPVTDIGAFGPRDYAHEMRLTAAEIHNKPTAGGAAATGGGAGSMAAAVAAGAARREKKRHDFKEGNFEIEASFREYIKPDGSIGLRDVSGWYERYENNGWRPVAERVLLDEDPVTTMTRLKRQPMFHYNPAVRREHRARVAKQRKRDWLRKMYAEGGFNFANAGGDATGAASAASSDPDAAASGSLTPHGMLGFDLDELDEGQLDQKAEELLAWSQHLDYGSYFDDWTSLACTLASEAFVPEEEAPFLEEIPGPHGSLAAVLAAAGVPQEPFKAGATPASGSVVALRS
ncbi:hypothetical protein Agub_g5540 [Astrephomene gubernaculifera]|uniref:IQ calmodulin-binding motif family protein n=1 Tax=Astrephomene gubernaculifera TaxID=47775 RepID=A0AAD3DP38_9CHLO|nr:hypothetical protein Agub_g5540 [Astrephomene gubernaculifera]